MAPPWIGLSRTDSNYIIREPQLEPATVIQNDRIGAIIKKNLQVPLFRMPREIRDQIWGHVIGPSRRIHLQLALVRSEEKMRHCVAENPADFRAYHHRCWRDDCNWREGCRKNGFHIYCCKDMDGSACQQINLSFLLTCRLLYVEATQLFYEQAAFSFSRICRFDDAITPLHAFVLSRNRLQKQSLRHIRIEMHMLGWAAVCRASRKIISLGELLTGLKTLHIGVKGYNKHDKGIWLSGLSKLRALDLEKVIITLSGTASGEEIEGVDNLRHWLMDPKGAEFEREEANKRDALLQEIRLYVRAVDDRSDELVGPV